MAIAGVRWMMTGSGEPLARTEFEPPPPGPGEVTVEVTGCGVCHTDLGFYYDGVRTTHALPLTLGHEISGRVVAAGADVQGWLGKSAIVSPVIPCGTCDACRRGRTTICPQQQMPGNTIHGGFASHVLVPARGLCAVDEARLRAAGLELTELSVVSDAVTTPYQAAVQAGVREGDVVIVVGVGGVGGYAVQICAALGGTVAAIDIDQRKLDALAGYGASLALNAGQLEARELKAALQAWVKDRGLRRREWIILECSGTRAGQETAFSLLNHGATLGVVGFTMDKVEVRLSNLMAFHARVLGNWGCPPELYPAALDLVLSGRVQVAPFVEQHPLTDINRVFESAHRGELRRRAVLVPAQ